jgi:uncharacterized protein (TIGR01777 family)
MRLGLTGASGFLGRAVQAHAQALGWQVVPIVRRPQPGAILWDAKCAFAHPAELEGLDSVIHLAGESIFALWTRSKRQAILESRVRSTQLLASSLAQCALPPKSLVSISAVGYYAEGGDRWIEPDDAPGSTFLSQVCIEWERAADPAQSAGIRVTHPRLGIILDPSGGALKAMLPSFRWGLGAVLGSGQQWISWVGLHDAAAALCWAAQASQATGSWNLVSPEPIRQIEFARQLAQTLHRPLWLHLPAPLLRLLGGELAQDLLLTSCRAAPFAPLLEGIPLQTKNICKIFSMI